MPRALENSKALGFCYYAIRTNVNLDSKKVVKTCKILHLLMEFIQEIIVGILLVGAVVWLFKKYKPSTTKNCSKGSCGCD